ncbi:MAG: SAM-dependent methyltransferase, partial [Sneathiellales bacterium]|nr:SAM-dependent methyltransferase [Sneathiellales bacterium]
TPGLGYYSGGSCKFGAEGDFVTSPEISPVFGQCLARQCQQVFTQLEQPEILEFGAGSGALAVALLRELMRLDDLPERYLILELSAELRHRQQQRLREEVPELFERVVWLDSLPDTFNGVVIANEVLDAMPVQRFRVDQGELFEQFVAVDGEGFALRWEPVQSSSLKADIEQLFPNGLPNDYESELNPQVAPWVEALSEVMASGLVLLIDYGYGRPEFYHPRRDRGTLICHYRHRAHNDPLVYPGLQDITANVDFTAVAEAGLAAGFALAGYSSQAFFLMGCGLDQIVAETDQSDAAGYLDLVQGVKRLTLPTEMGERFKVLGLSKGVDGPFIGFSVREERERL